jgi:hypothetical protein
MASDDENDGFGLDKNARLRYERLERLEGRQPVRLEPDFPFVAEPAFDPEVFEIPANPRVKKDP